MPGLFPVYSANMQPFLERSNTMADLKLWKVLEDWKTNYEWVDLTHELTPGTPHWVGFPAMEVTPFFDLDSSLFRVYSYTFVGQYGTHIDVATHMLNAGRTLEQIRPDEMVLPLCVIDKTAEVAADSDYRMTRQDIETWEKIHGIIPEEAFVVFRSDWSRRAPGTFDNLDADGSRHFPGWSMESLQYLVEERNISGIGHETSDTEAPVTSGETSYEVEHYILAQDRFQIELLTNVDRCPPVGALVFCTFPKVRNATGFPARCFALCPK